MNNREAFKRALAALDEAAARIEELEARQILLNAECDGLGSMLLSVQTDCIAERKRAEAAEAKLATARNDALEEAADASEMWTCSKCGAIFHPKKNPHTDADCAVGHSAWDGPISSDEVTAAIRALKTIKQT